MAIGGPLSQNFTYGKVEDDVRITTGLVDNTVISPSLMLSEISLSVNKIATILNGLTTRFYGTKNQTLTLAGSANPYTIDMTGISPFPIKISRVVHVTGAGARTSVQKMTAEQAQNKYSVSDNFAPSVAFVDMGDTLEFWAASGFTVTTATDKIHIYYFRQPTISNATRTTYLDLLDVFVPFVVQDLITKFTAYLQKRPVTAEEEAKLTQGVTAIWNSIGAGKSMGVEEKP